MHSNHTSHLLFTSTFYSFKSDLFLIPKVLDSNRLSIKIPTEKVMYTQGEKAKPSLPSPPIQLKEMQNPFQTEKDWLIPQSFLKATSGTSQCFHTVCALFFSPTSWSITWKEAGGSLLLWGEDIASHFSYNFSNALPAATAPAGVFFLGFLYGFFVWLKQCIKFYHSKILFSTSFKEIPLTPQAICVDGEEQFYHNFLSLSQRRILTEKNQNKINSF